MPIGGDDAAIRRDCRARARAPEGLGDRARRGAVRAIELAIGKDLQYIRVNGTLVGGLIGLVLFGATPLA